MDRKGHLALDKVMFNQEFPEVHRWLDSTYPKYANQPVPYMHWLNYHHREAITERFGAYTAEYNSAYLHILTDFLYHFGRAYVPENMTALVDTFLDIGVIKRDY